MGRETRTGSVDQAPLCEAKGGAGRGLVARWRLGMGVGFLGKYALVYFALTMIVDSGE